MKPIRKVYLAESVFISPKTCKLYDDEEVATYIFLSEAQEIIYVGATRNVNKRLNNHRLKKKDKFNDEIYLIEIITGIPDWRAFELEKEIMNNHSPKYNGDPTYYYNMSPRF
ncbi:GIY-YIG nuclease family protein [Paenibacillaceae bacterium]|nr:GIY-YIG nuclease family protein [Paenibacillaceae bacterium]